MEENNKINDSTTEIIKSTEELTTEQVKEELSKTEAGQKLILTMEQVEAIRKKLRKEDINTSITLQDCIDIADGFINGTVSVDELESFGTRMSIRAYIPILEKMSVLMKVLMEYEISAVESTEIKMVELYKHIFYSVVLGLYGQVQIDPIKDKELMTYENYDKLFPIFYQYIIGYCKTDYDVFMSMFNDCVSWNGVVKITEELEQIDSEVLKETSESNKELINSLKENSKVVEDMKDLLMATDRTTQEVVSEIKKTTVKEVIKEKLNKENNKSDIINT